MIVDLGCGWDPARWIPKSVKVDEDRYNVKRKDVVSVDELPQEEPYEPIFQWSALEHTLPFRDRSVGAVFATNSLQYMYSSPEELSHILKEVHRVLDFGGRFVVHDYCHVLNPEAKRIDDVEYQIIDDRLSVALRELELEGTFEVAFANVNRTDSTFTWILVKY